MNHKMTFSTMVGTETADLVIIGAGIVGVATAFFASRAGFRTVLLEKKSSWGQLNTAEAAECFRAQWKQPFNIQMMLESIRIFENFAEEIGVPDYDIGLRQNGYLYVTKQPDNVRKLEASVDYLKANGVTDIEYLTAAEVKKRFPYVSADAMAGRFRYKDGWVDSRAVMQGFLLGCRASHFRFQPNAEVIGISHNNSEITSVAIAGLPTIHTPRIVIAAGPFSEKIANLAGVKFPSQMTFVNLSRCAVHIGQVDHVPNTAPMTIDCDTGAWWRPIVRPNQVPGALAGQHPEPIFKHREEIFADPDAGAPTWDFRVKDKELYVAHVQEGVANLCPFWDDNKIWNKSNVNVRGGQYTYCFADSNPLIGQHPELKGLFFNTCFSGHGIMNAPAASKFLIQLIQDPDRYDGKYNEYRFGRFTDGSELKVEDMAL